MGGQIADRHLRLHHDDLWQRSESWHYQEVRARPAEHANPNPDANPNTDPDTDTDTDAYPDTHTYADTNPNTNRSGYAISAKHRLGQPGGRHQGRRSSGGQRRVYGQQCSAAPGCAQGSARQANSDQGVRHH
ncbi:IgG-binding virulence factor TspB family protein [Massilia sp. CF038]|uniref:IgG-binding virulence factor TspB family protein n=1 Tax=Massilia sp. CF038 TaxID=1881045 RepID=UPI0035A304FC